MEGLKQFDASSRDVDFFEALKRGLGLMFDGLDIRTQSIFYNTSATHRGTRHLGRGRCGGLRHLIVLSPVEAGFRTFQDRTQQSSNRLKL